MRRIRRELAFVRQEGSALLPSRSRAQLDEVRGALADTRARLEALAAVVDRQQGLIAELTADVVRHQRYLDDPRADRVLAISAWIAAAPVPEDRLVTVVMPTYNRSDRLMRAVESVRAQSYRNWELVVVDDGSDADQRPALEALGDPRIRPLRQSNAGVAAAFNRGLEEARGDLIAYLEDDNTMAPGWLHAAAWAMAAFPDVEYLYGAMVWEDDAGILGEARATGLPMLEFRPWDRAFLERHSYIHIGASVHRRGLPEQGFNTELTRAQDYDFALRATRDRTPLALPVVAGCYATSNQDRLSISEDVTQSIARIQRLHGYGEAPAG